MCTKLLLLYQEKFKMYKETIDPTVNLKGCQTSTYTIFFVTSDGYWELKCLYNMMLTLFVKNTRHFNPSIYY